MEHLLVLGVPFITTGIMFAFKWLAGLYMTGDGPEARPWPRALLVLTSFLG